MIDRRAFVAASSGLLMTSGLTLPRRAFAADYGHIGKEPPLSDFTRDSTSEEVTAGLDLTGKTVVITGANSGLGYETMRVLAMRGAHVIGTGRTAEKAETAAASVEGNVTPVVLELTDFDSIAACARDIEALGAPVDVLICNAGIMALPERELVRGIERQFAVNHLGHFVFSNLLLDSVKAAPQGRFVIVSSDGYKSAPEDGIQFDDLSWEAGYEPWTAYGHSKLANQLFAQELGRRLQGSTATANSIHPGVIATNLARHMMPGIAVRFVSVFGGWFIDDFKSTPQGAATQCYVATAPALEGVSGVYFADCNPREPETPHMLNEDMAARLWDVSVELSEGYVS